MRYWEDILEPKLEVHLGFRNNRNQGLECCQALSFWPFVSLWSFFSKDCFSVPFPVGKIWH